MIICTIVYRSVLIVLYYHPCDQRTIVYRSAIVLSYHPGDYMYGSLSYCCSRLSNGIPLAPVSLSGFNSRSHFVYDAIGLTFVHILRINMNITSSFAP